jgi:putative ABC transport system permease protein
VGDAISQTLFRHEDPVGKSLRIGRSTYRVIGVVAKSQASGGGGGEGIADLPSQNADLYVPLTTLKSYEGDMFIQVMSGSTQSEYIELHELIVSTNSMDEVLPTSKVIEQTLAATHPKADFKVIVPLRLLEQAQRTQAIFSIVLGSIAAISLLVGGIGIMNIMLASVSERTREIGIRRALGARQNDIMLQFLVECLILSVGGGLVGMAFGAAIPAAVTRFTDMPTVLTPDAFILSFAVSGIVGIVFGLYPARRAAVMDPIEALRHE